MKIAVWRYGLPLQTAAESKVGGGLLTEAVLQALQGHDVQLLDKAQGSLAGCDAAVVLTGPSNGLYAGYRRTYELLDGFKGKAFYCQWDCALPFQFNPAPIKGEPLPSPMGACWTVLTQVERQHVNERACPEGVRHHLCFFELAELDQQWLAPCTDPIPAIGYFGSDRPGRLPELERWAQSDVPIHVHGRWSDKSRARLQRPNVVFHGPVPEQHVAERLNRYAATLYIADSAYVRQDFVAQRFFENARAAVPTFYSDKLQPSIKRALINTPGGLAMMVKTPGQLAQRFAALAAQDRSALVQTHQAMARRIRVWKPGHTVAEAFEALLQ